ncbi:MAG: DNA topoisomerase 3 [Clostridia bacterium]|nr:DNA topoisomerase 3 [Clostridia bacterium]
MAEGRWLVVAEKPSVGRDIARVLGCRERGDGCLIGADYTVTWAVGHLVTLKEPDEIDARYKKWTFAALPILPEEIPLKVIRQTASQFKIVSALMNGPETAGVICATDAGREGELIFRYIYTMAKCVKPVRRLWISSMTDEAIAEGFRAIRPGEEYDGLYRSARCRSEADWLVGMNASRAFTLRYDSLLSVGRVQTPTLALLVRRRQEIEQFRPESYAVLTADFGDYRGTWFSADRTPDNRLKDRAEAEAVAARVKGRRGTIVRCETQRKHVQQPQLYDLTSLQRDANSLLGFTADKTLKLAQSLYEKHKALTYPRTDSRYLPPDMIPRVVQTMRLLPDAYQPMVPSALPDGKLPVSKRTVDASKVSDHHALIPTARRVNPADFSPDERALYDLVARRLLTAFYPEHIYDGTTVVTAVGEDTFRTRGRVTVQEGWRAIPPTEKPPKKTARKKEADEEEETVLPPLKQGDERDVRGTQIREDQTRPPAQLTDASLLAAMERAGRDSDDREIAEQMKGSGIGTPATRAAIIERLIQVGYAQRRGKNLLATDKGVQLIAVCPPELSSAETTGRWELALDRITRGEQDPERFMDGIRRFSAFLVDYARDRSPAVNFPEEERKGKGGRTRVTASAKKLDGCVCPVCGKGQVTETPLAFGCSAKGCRFTLWKDGLTRGGGPAMTEALLRLLLKEKTVRGSTGVLQLTQDRILFTPNGASAPGASRSLIYEKTPKPAGKQNGSPK